jgi:purine nucleoside permease
MHKGTAVGAALAAIVMASSAWGAAKPERGKYLAKIVVARVHSAECPDRLDAHYDGVVEYPGLSGTRATIRIPIILDGYTVIEDQVLKITSGSGTVRPRGSLSILLISNEIDVRLTGSLDGVLTLSDDPEAFRARVTETVPLIDCTEVFRLALVRSG